MLFFSKQYYVLRCQEKPISLQDESQKLWSTRRSDNRVIVKIMMRSESATPVFE